MRTNDHKLAQRQQLVFVTPAAAVLLAGIIYERINHGGQDALHYVAWIIPVLVAATLAGRLASARDLRRLTQLQRGAERLEAGHYETLNLDQRSDDEFSDLARAFNHMVEVLAARDATQRQQNHKLAELNRRMETVLDATNDGIALLDRSGAFALVNRRFCEMLGVDQDTILGRLVLDVHAEMQERTSSFDRLIERVAPDILKGQNRTSGVAEEVIEVISSERRFLQVYTASVHDDRRSMNGRIIALHDITRETELDRMKTDFIGVVSHELRTPLTSIKGYTDIMLNEQAGEINELQREFLSIIQGSASRLNNLINDMLDISRLESGQIEVKAEKVNYDIVIEDTLRMMKSVADEKSIELIRDLPISVPEVRGDSDKITQVMVNLVSNAVKYTPKGGKVTVSIAVSGASITTCIADTGIGISADDQRKLFQKFFRADNSTTREAGGTGLGLVIVKSMVELLGGAVWVESEPGEGSKFYFTLPVYKNLLLTGDASIDDVDSVLATITDSKPVKLEVEDDTDEPRIHGTDSRPVMRRLLDRGLGLVMVVGSDNSFRAGLHHTLHRMGYGVITAQDAISAVDRARVHRPDVILLDILTAKRDRAHGLSILHSLQTDPAAQSLPIVSYTIHHVAKETNISICGVSLLDKSLSTASVASRFTSLFPAGKTIKILGVSLGGNISHFEETAPELLERNIIINGAQDFQTALTLAANGKFDLVLLDNSSQIPAIQFDRSAALTEITKLLGLLKTDPKAGVLPIAITVHPYSSSLNHFHLGHSHAVTHSAAFDYLADQVAKVMIERGLGPSGMQLAA